MLFFLFQICKLQKHVHIKSCNYRSYVTRFLLKLLHWSVEQVYQGNFTDTSSGMFLFFSVRSGEKGDYSIQGNNTCLFIGS